MLRSALLICKKIVSWQILWLLNCEKFGRVVAGWQASSAWQKKLSLRCVAVHTGKNVALGVSRYTRSNMGTPFFLNNVTEPWLLRFKIDAFENPRSFWESHQCVHFKITKHTSWMENLNCSLEAFFFLVYAICICIFGHGCTTSSRLCVHAYAWSYRIRS